METRETYVAIINVYEKFTTVKTGPDGYLYWLANYIDGHSFLGQPLHSNNFQHNALLACVDTNGVVRWWQELAQPGSGLFFHAVDLDISPEGHLWVYCHYEDSVRLAGQVYRSPPNQSGIVLQCYSTDGTLRQSLHYPELAGTGRFRRRSSSTWQTDPGHQHLIAVSDTLIYVSAMMDNSDSLLVDGNWIHRTRNNLTGTGVILKLTPCHLQAAAEITWPACEHQGQTVLRPQQGRPPYRFAWSDGRTDSIRTDLAPGSYSVTVTDRRTCVDSLRFSVAPADPLRLHLEAAESPRCAAAADGRIHLRASGGRPPYRWLWPDGEGSSQRADLMAGSWSLTLIDADGCTADTLVELLDPPPLHLDTVETVPPRCARSADGRIRLKAHGGHPPYRFNWPDGRTDSLRTDLPAGWQTFRLTDSKGCTQSMEVFLDAPPELSGRIEAIESASCPALADGQAHIEAVGGTPPYTFRWSDGASVNRRRDLLPQPYTLTLTDAQGCTAELSLQVGIRDSLRLREARLQAASCAERADGKAEIQLAGGTPPYSLHWSDGGGGHLRTDLRPGSYFVTSRDRRGCTRRDSFFVDAPPPLELSLSPEPDNGQFGVLRWIARGGTPPYRYAWPDGAVDSARTGLEVGSYRVVVTDAKGCRTEAVGSVLSPPPQPLRWPNVITPNGDGINDELRFEGGPVEQFQCRVYDRWGQLVFASQDIGQVWSATQVPAVVYWVELSYQLVGESQAKPIRFSVTVLR